MKITTKLQLMVLCCLLMGMSVAGAESEPAPLTIADPFIELRTGPASSYPVFHVIDRGEQILVLRQKTVWFKIRASDGKEGWVNKQQLQQTLLPDGARLQLSELQQDAFIERNWEIGMMTGELEDAPVNSVYGAYNFTKNFATELTLSHSTGNVSSSTIYKVNLMMQPFPQWKYSPYFSMGLGNIDVDPQATLINPEDRSNQIGQIGFGIKRYLSRRFILRFEFNDYVVFSASNDRDDNEDISEWKLGFAVFY
ncbi:MAG: SH3 domain-containing protein [Gammaproteobacteria bacterium]|nr:SH3 domain-containing protein [Gammaproteobacteria bacterium]